MTNNIVQDWLRSLGLVNYTQSFLDNGYDDLEICKQIGCPDLDAIGVHVANERETILKAVQTLREKGATPVYFTLEAPACNGDNYQNGVSLQSSGNMPVYEESRQAIVTYPRLQLRMLIKDKLNNDKINLADPKFTEQENSGRVLKDLARHYALQLKTNIRDVFEALQEHQHNEIYKDSDESSSPNNGEDKSPTNMYGLFSIYGQTARSVPPPLPASVPPSFRKFPDLQSGQSRSLPGSPRMNAIVPSLTLPSCYDDTATEHSNKKKTLPGLGRLLRNVTLRRSGKKYAYRQHEGDLLASQITMCDEDRIQLMVQVKEGRVSMQE